MKVDFSSSIRYMHPIGPSLNEERLKLAVTFIGIGILLGFAAFWLYNAFGNHRLVRIQSPRADQDHFDRIVAQAALDSLVFDHDESHDDSPVVKSVGPPPVEQNKPIEEKLIVSDLPGERIILKLPIQLGDNEVQVKEPKEDVQPTDLNDGFPEGNESPILTDESIVGTTDDEILDNSVSEEMSDMDESVDCSLTIEERIDRNPKKWLKYEKDHFTYAGMFTRYDGVYAALKCTLSQATQEPIYFCNQAFKDHFDRQKEKSSHWDLCISLEAATFFEAWKIVSDEVELSDLALHGSIQSPEKGITLHFLAADDSKEQEIRNFLTLLAHHLSQASIAPGAKLSNNDHTAASISCEGIPEYFSYCSDLIYETEDKVWDMLRSQAKNAQEIIAGNILMHDSKYWVKTSYYQTPGVERVNPLAWPNPFQTLQIKSWDA